MASSFEALGKFCDGMTKGFFAVLLWLALTTLVGGFLGFVAALVFGFGAGIAAAIVGAILGIPITIGVLRLDIKQKTQKAEAGTSAYAPPLILIFKLPPSQPASVAA